MSLLPLILDEEDALLEYSSDKATDATKAYSVSELSKLGYSNKDIRNLLGIEKAYTVTHLLRAAKHLTQDELELWHNNPSRITLGHIRAIALLSYEQRLELLNKLMATRISVRKFEQLSRDINQNITTDDADITRLEIAINEQLGIPTKIRFNPYKQNGKLTFSFFGLDDLEHIISRMGVKLDADW